MATSQPLFDILQSLEVERCLLWQDPRSGLRAVVVVDDVSLGPAAGGIRTRGYPDWVAALRDAAALAQAMTLKCALAGLRAGGCKIVVLDAPSMDRPAAFERLGCLVDELGGLVRTAGDLGTTEADLQHAARHTRFVHLGEEGLASSVARGLLRCVEACLWQHNGTQPRDLGGLRVAVQGCGAIGAAVAEALHTAGASLVLADLDERRARELAGRLARADVIDPAAVLSAEVDVVAPCAVGGVVTHEVASSLRAWAVVGAANNVLADGEVARRLAARNVLLVPDVIASAGAVIDGIGRTVMGLDDRTPLIDALGDTALAVLRQAQQQGKTTTEVAAEMARSRLQAARAAKVPLGHG